MLQHIRTRAQTCKRDALTTHKYNTEREPAAIDPKWRDGTFPGIIMLRAKQYLSLYHSCYKARHGYICSYIFIPQQNDQSSSDFVFAYSTHYVHYASKTSVLLLVDLWKRWHVGHTWPRELACVDNTPQLQLTVFAEGLKPVPDRTSGAPFTDLDCFQSQHG